MDCCWLLFFVCLCNMGKADCFIFLCFQGKNCWIQVKQKLISKYCRHQCTYYSTHYFGDLRNLLPLLSFRNYKLMKCKKVVHCMVDIWLRILLFWDLTLCQCLVGFWCFKDHMLLQNELNQSPSDITACPRRMES